jgi:hypothetical protein
MVVEQGKYKGKFWYQMEDALKDFKSTKDLQKLCMDMIKIGDSIRYKKHLEYLRENLPLVYDEVMNKTLITILTEDT